MAPELNRAAKTSLATSQSNRNYPKNQTGTGIPAFRTPQTQTTTPRPHLRRFRTMETMGMKAGPTAGRSPNRTEGAIRVTNLNLLRSRKAHQRTIRKSYCHRR